MIIDARTGESLQPSTKKSYPIHLWIAVYEIDPRGGPSKRIPKRIVVSVDADSADEAASRFQAALMSVIRKS